MSSEICLVELCFHDSHLNFFDDGLEKLVFVRVLGQDRGPLDQRLVRLNIFVADGGRTQAHLEGDSALDLLVHAPDLGLAEGAFVLGGHLGADGKRTLALKGKVG